MIVIDGAIGDPTEADAVFYTDVLAALRACGDPMPVVQVTSWGGSAREGIAIYDAIRCDGRPTVTRVRRIASSAGALVAMAGDRVEIEADAFLMFHGAIAYVAGDGPVFGIAADLIDQTNQALAAAMARISGRSVAHELTQLIAAGDRWLSADEALQAGYVHAIVAPHYGRLP